jgi:hypothetical protein
MTSNSERREEREKRERERDSPANIIPQGVSTRGEKTRLIT